MKEKLIEYHLMCKIGGKWKKVETFNTSNCGWTNPIEEWVSTIRDKFMSEGGYWQRRYGNNLRLIAIYQRNEIVVDMKYS